MKNTEKPSPGFVRQGRCRSWYFPLFFNRYITRVVLGKIINNQVSARVSSPKLVSYLLNLRSGQFVQVCANDINSTLNFRFDTYDENGGRITLAYSGKISGLKSFATQNKLTYA